MNSRAFSIVVKHVRKGEIGKEVRLSWWLGGSYRCGVESGGRGNRKWAIGAD